MYRGGQPDRQDPAVHFFCALARRQVSASGLAGAPLLLHHALWPLPQARAAVGQVCPLAILPVSARCCPLELRLRNGPPCFVHNALWRPLRHVQLLDRRNTLVFSEECLCRQESLMRGVTDLLLVRKCSVDSQLLQGIDCMTLHTDGYAGRASL